MKNEKSTFSVLFYLKKDKMKKNGLVPIHARITISGKQTQFNTKLEVFEANWKSGRAIGKSMEIQRLNSMLDDIKANIRSHFHNQLMRDSYVTPESVKNALLGKEEEALTILSFFEQHNDQYKKKVGAGEATPKTYSRYELTKLRLAQYLKDEYRVSDLPIRQINKVFIENFYLYIIKNHDCSPNTAMKFIQRFRTVVNFAQSTGLIAADPFAHYKLKFEYIERGYLDKEEIHSQLNSIITNVMLDFSLFFIKVIISHKSVWTFLDNNIYHFIKITFRVKILNFYINVILVIINIILKCVYCIFFLVNKQYSVCHAIFYIL